jgi:hypothetical protein
MTEDKPEDIQVDKGKFDSLLRKMIATKPLPLKDIVGTFQRPRKPKKEG